MTLSRWLRDYLYISLGGSRGRRWLTYRNLLITMLLGGLWHGASWMFVIWGGLHGGWLVAERWLRERRGRARSDGADGWLRVGVQRLVIFHFVCFAWIFFRSETLGTVGEVLRGLVSDWTTVDVALPVLLGLVVGLGSQAISKARIDRLQLSFASLHPSLQGAALACFLFTLDLLGPDGVAAFIYFQF